MNRFLSSLLLISSLVAIRSEILAASQDSDDWRDIVVEKHMPDYGLLARGYGFGGQGKYRLEIDPNSGNVTSVSVVKSTAHKILDDAAISALRRWRFRAHSPPSIIIPVE